MIDRRTAIKSLAAGGLAGGAFNVATAKPRWNWVLKDVGASNMYFCKIQQCGKARVWVRLSEHAMCLPPDTHPDSLRCIRNIIEGVTGSDLEWVKR